MEASFPQRRDRAVAGMIRRGRKSAIALGVLLIGLGLIGLGISLLQRGSVGDGAATTSKELLVTTKGLQVTQQQAVDQLQIVQDQLATQKAETKKLSEQIAILTERPAIDGEHSHSSG